MKTSQKGIDLIKEFESLSLTAYLCPASVWTIGWGTTKGVTQGMRITQQQADDLFAEDLAEFEGYINKYVKRKLNQNQFDALVSFVYNVGVGNLLKSTLLKLVKANPNDEGIAAQFGQWIYAGGKKSNGLRRRRQREAELYFTKVEDEAV